MKGDKGLEMWVERREYRNTGHFVIKVKVLALGRGSGLLSVSGIIKNN